MRSVADPVFADSPVGRSVRRAVGAVVDPCSVAMGIPIDLAEMGLVVSVAIDESAGRVDIVLRLTSACCAYGPLLATSVQHELQALDWVGDARVRIDHSSLWAPELMGREAMERLEARRSLTRALPGTAPHDWTVRSATTVGVSPRRPPTVA